MGAKWPHGMKWMFDEADVRRCLKMDPESIPGWPNDHEEVDPHLGVWIADGRAVANVVDFDGTTISWIPVEWEDRFQHRLYDATMDRVLDDNA